MSTPAPFFKGTYWKKRADAPSRTEAGHCARRAAETSPAPAGGGSGKEKHPEMLGKMFFADVV